jgi:peptidyl-prolyl cis-trans isomerase SurA
MKHWLIKSLIVGIFFIPAVQGEEILDRIITRVDQWVITKSDLEEASAQSIAEIQKTYPKSEWNAKISELQNQIMSRMIDEYVCAAAARELEITITDEEIDAHIKALRESAGITSDEQFKEELAREGMTLEEFKESIRRQSLARKVLQREVYSKVEVNKTDIETYYEEHLSVYEQPAKVRVALLLLGVNSPDDAAWVRTEEQAQTLYRSLTGGADFAELVKLHSQGPAVDQGGDIGFIEKGKGLPVFEDVAFALNVGDISKPFRTDHGWNIIQIMDRVDRTVKPVSEVSADIDKFLRMLKSRDLETEWLEKQRNRTFIERIKTN